MLFLASGLSSAATDWASISPLLPSHSEKLPVVPDRASAEQLFGGVNLGGGSPFAAFTVGSASTTSLTDSRMDVAELEVACNLSTAALVAGPRFVCTSDDVCGASSCVCRGLSTGSEPCMAVMNAGSVQLVTKPGSSGWAQLVSVPSWIQHTFPAVPVGASSITLRFKMDGRYRPQLYGGNPCPNASSTYNCSLCTTGPWDHRPARRAKVLSTTFSLFAFRMQCPPHTLPLLPTWL